MDSMLAVWTAADRSRQDAADVPDRNKQRQIESVTPEDLKVLHEQQGIVAISKPSGITTELVIALLENKLSIDGRDSRVTCVSRLDFSTSGVLVAALGDERSASTQWLEAQFAGRLVSKGYVALCTGESLGPPGTSGNVNSRLLTKQVGDSVYHTTVSKSGKEAWTEYEVLATTREPCNDGGHLMLLLVQPHTGRTHQIRAHMASLGRPILDDSSYGGRKVSWCPRVFLHCYRTKLRSIDGIDFIAEALLPEDLLGALQQVSPMEGDFSMLLRPSPSPQHRATYHP